MKDDLLRQWRRMMQDLERQQEQLRSLLGPVGALQGARDALAALRRHEREQAISEQLLRAAFPAGLAGEALGRSYLALEEFRRQALSLAAAQSALEAFGFERRQLLGATLQSTDLAAALEAFRSPRVPALEGLSARLSLSARNVYADMAAAPGIAASMSVRLVEAPALAVYTSTRSITVMRQAPSQLLIEHEDASAEEALAEIGDELESRLARLGPEYAEAYRGAMTALRRQDPDWVRHVGASLRQLTDSLIVRFAPDPELETHYPDSENEKENGSFTRKARLTYIFRSVAVGSYTRMARNHVEITASIFYPANDAVHILQAPLTPEQVRVFTRQVQGCISILLEAAGY